MDSMTEQTHDYRVRALEDQLGISTSDAQAMVDAEDLLAQRLQKRRPTRRSQRAKRNNPCAPFTGGDLTG